MWWRCTVLPSLPWVVCFLSFFLYKSMTPPPFLKNPCVVSGGPSRLRGGGRAGVLKNKKQKTRGGPGLSPPSGSRKYAQGGQGGGAGKQHQVRAGGMALRVGFEQGFPGLDHYWCRHTSPHEVSGAQCLSRRLILAVFQLVFVFRLGGPTPSEAAGGRPLTEKSKTDGLGAGLRRPRMPQGVGAARRCSQRHACSFAVGSAV